MDQAAILELTERLVARVFWEVYHSCRYVLCLRLRHCSLSYFR